MAKVVRFHELGGPEVLRLEEITFEDPAPGELRLKVSAIGLKRPLVDPCHLREMPLTVLVDREGRIAISHAGVVDPLAFEADINALLVE
jgi:NADPH:quinone reductase-like Zn-dependent oxidoreductase